MGNRGPVHRPRPDQGSSIGQKVERAVEAGARRIHTGDAALPEDPGAEADGIRRFKLHLGFRVDPCTRGVRVHRPLPRKMGRAVLGAYRFLRGGGE